LRYAIYYTPDRNHPLTKAAAQWLGRDAFCELVFDHAQPTEWSLDEQRSLVADAARYGFHATLKAPFSLSGQRSEIELVDALGLLQVNPKELVIPSLELRQIDGFFALVPAAPVEAIQEFAALIVQQFDQFRAPLTPADMARRKPEKLTERQRGYLEKWGYPYVFEEFFFHMTLTNRVSPKNVEIVRRVLERRFGAFIGRDNSANFSVLSLRSLDGPPLPFKESQTDDR
jgi:Protein of unknown function (DUF1045)